MLFNGDVPAIRAYARESGRVSHSPYEVQGCLLKKRVPKMYTIFPVASGRANWCLLLVQKCPNSLLFPYR